ncbi:MAG: hypothetical protein HY043_03315 [Verrucomicrobia bacterium]|nr:hypothetical protein [Verrucomicrobiota bacterium]
MKTVTSKHNTDGKLKNGLFKEHYKGGSLACVGKYRSGEKIGVWKRYHPNGALYDDEGNFANDEKIGEWRIYDAKGKLVKITKHKSR